MILGFGLTAIFSGRGIATLLLDAAAAFGGYLHDAANAFAKGLKVLLLAGKVIGEIAGQVLAMLRTVAAWSGRKPRRSWLWLRGDPHHRGLVPPPPDHAFGENL